MKKTNLPKLSTSKALSELRAVKKGFADSYRETDGVIRDKDALVSMAAIQAGIDAIRSNGA